MRRRDGFTVLELVVALSLTAVALGLTGTALSAARSTEEAIARSRATTLPSRQAQALLTDLLRHLPRPEEVDGPLLTLSHDGPSPVLAFLSRGLEGPYGTGPLWSIRVSQQRDSVRIAAEPLRGRTAASPRQLVVPTTAPLVIEALVAMPSGVTTRHADWHADLQLPTAVAVRWDRQAPGAQGTELLVVLDPLGARR